MSSMDFFRAKTGNVLPFTMTGEVSITLAIAALMFLIFLWNCTTLNEQAENFSVNIPEQCAGNWDGDVLQTPSVKVPGSSVVQCYSPASGRLLGTVNAASPNHIDRAISKAAAAQKCWALTNFSERRKVLRTLLRFILENQDAISTAACLDSGKTKVDASFGEILVTAERIKWTLLHGERALKAEARPTSLLMSYKVNEVRWEPMGVIGACVSWNYPFHNLLGPMISGTFAGNGVIVKGSESTAWSANFFTEIFRGALKACGHPPNLVQSIVCWPNSASYLTSHPQISHLTFIGSREIAFKVAASAAQSLTPLCLELGGKDAAIVLDDVKDLKKVASILMRGVFQSSGQNCIGIERVVACPRVYQRLIDIVLPRIQRLRLGDGLLDSDPIDLGSMISNANFERLESLIIDAVKNGATLLCGGSAFQHPAHPGGHYFQPTLLVDVERSMAIAQNEVFAPIFTLMPAKDVDDAMEIANSTDFGLGASVFGSSRKDIDQVVAMSRTGMVSVNDFATYYAVQLPFGGVKGSGYGRFAAKEGLRSLCNTKSVCRDRFPSLMSTAIPASLDYPIKSTAKAWQVCCGVVELGYGLDWKSQVAGLWKTVKNSM